MTSKKRFHSYVTPYIDPIEIKIISKKIIDKCIGEKILFQLLDEYRIKSNREFFKCELSIIKKTMDQVECILKNEPIDKLQKIYLNNSINETKNIMIELINEQKNDDDIILYNKFDNKNEQLKNKLKIELTAEIIKEWHGKEYILDNALYALGKKQHDNTDDPRISNMDIKIDYLNTILNFFGFKNLLDDETIVKSDDDLKNKMKNSEFLIKANYSILMKTFNKRERANEIEGKFQTDKFIKICNCVLNEFGFKIENSFVNTKINRKSCRKYSYFLRENMKNIINIIKKY